MGNTFETGAFVRDGAVRAVAMRVLLHNTNSLGIVIYKTYPKS